jgi:D-serine deaminase-like pyridoxal phosphate-dependent protein
VAAFIDLNPGMDRTGAAAAEESLLALAARLAAAGLPLAGLHWYDGQIGGVPPEQRAAVAHAGYGRLLQLAAALAAAGIAVPELITSGTPAMPYALSYAPFAQGPAVHRISPGTPVYGDLTSLAQLPAAWGYRPAALVLAAVVSHPRPGRITCDAGSKVVGADAGVPTCAVLGHPDWSPARPSEEHLPVDLPAGAPLPPIGTQLYLLARHICPTINNFDTAVIVSGGRALRVEPVTARGHEPAAPLVG